MGKLLHQWHCNKKTISLGENTLVMGILNTTPDSFSDGGLFNSARKGLKRAVKMAEEGADIIDIGGESSRPGAKKIDVAEEINRTIPIIKLIRQELPNILVSIDTTKSQVAEKALQAGADIVNDISAMTFDPKIKQIIKKYNAGLILMHMQGTPQDMQINPQYKDVYSDVKNFLSKKYKEAEEAGINRQSIILDPGIGFGKSLEHNLTLLKSLDRLTNEMPILLGLSRKSFIGSILNRANPNERLSGGLAANAYAIMKGAHILRVHDVLETCDLCKIMDNLLREEV
tara:strand:+ start:41 stop:898 length:858 start_codon:yes stop_codon:yes gene_type:complete